MPVLYAEVEIQFTSGPVRPCADDDSADVPTLYPIVPFIKAVSNWRELRQRYPRPHPTDALVTRKDGARMRYWTDGSLRRG